MAIHEFRKVRQVEENDEPIVETRVVHDELVERDTRYSVVYYILNIVLALLLIRLILRLFAANPTAGFTETIYSITNPLVAPFTGIFPTPVVSGTVLEWSTIIAMIVYALIAYGIVQLLRIASRSSHAV